MTLPPSTSWAPADNRTAAYRTASGVLQPIVWQPKDPGATLDYSIEIETSERDIYDTLGSVSAVVLPSGLTVAATGITGNIATLWLSGGTALISYAVTATLTMASGRVLTAVAGITVTTAVAGASGSAPVYTSASLAAAIAVLPTSPAGLAAGAIWNDGGVIKQVQA